MVTDPHHLPAAPSTTDRRDYNTLRRSLARSVPSCAGGRHNMPPPTAMLHGWQTTLDQGGAVTAVLVDFKKAFNFVNHNLLLQ